MLQNARVTAFTVSELLKEIKGKPTGGVKLPPLAYLPSRSGTIF